MVNYEYVPARGDIVWLSFSPQAGHERAGHRPALVLSQEAYSRKTGLALFCPVASRIKGYPFEVVLPDTSPVSGVVLADQVKSLDWRARNARFECHASRRVVGEALEKVGVLLD